MTTELNVQGGMHIEPDPKTGAIAATADNPDTQKAAAEAVKDDQPEQTAVAANDQPEPQVNPRDAIMKKIYEGRADQFKNELEYASQMSAGATNVPGSDDPAQQPDAVETKPEPAQPKPEQAQKSPQPQPVQPQARKPYIINGQQVELTDQELAQLASRSMQQTSQVIQQYQRQPQQQPQYQQPQQQPVQQPQNELLAPDRLREIVRKITYGSEDESVNALRDFADRTAQTVQRAQGPTPEQIAAYAAQTALAQVSFQTNLNTIASEFPDVFERRSATLVAADNVNSLRNRYQLLGTMKQDLELYREACQLARAEFGNQQGQQQQSQTSQPAAVQTSQQRTERKRAAPQPPAAVARVVPQQTNNVVTGSDIVSKMRQSRGQMPLN